jgi:hypothetical protein
MQSTASGKDSVLFGENLSLRRGCFPVCRQGMSSAADLCLLYTLSLIGETIPPGGFPKPAGMVYCNYYYGKVASAAEDSRTNNSRRTAVCRKAGSVFSFSENRE